jgi:hypothetical protein
MPEISYSNLDLIIRDIARQNIFYSHLTEELIDHICCDVEEEMHGGLDFSEAYTKVKGKLGTEGLRKIQEDTLYAVDTKYRHMKRTMKISAITGTILLSFAALFKISHLPFAGVMMLLGALTLLLVFLPSAMNVLWKETRSGGRLFLLVSGFITGAALILGILFKVQHWPGAGLMITLSAAAGIILLIPSVLLVKLRDPESRAKRPIYITGAVAMSIYFAGLLFKVMHWSPWELLTIAGTGLLFLVVIPWYTFSEWRNEENISTRFIFLVIAPLIILVPATFLNLNTQLSYDEGFDMNLERQIALGVSLGESNISFIEKQTELPRIEAMRKLHAETEALLSTMKMQADIVGPPANDSIVKRNITSAIDEYREVLTSTGFADENFDRLISLTTYLTPDGKSEIFQWPVSLSYSIALLRNGVLTAESLALEKIAYKQ